jgi:hypothetical protein
MGATARARTFIGIASGWAVAVAADWLIGLHGLGVAFAVGGAVVAAVLAASNAGTSAIQLSAVTSEPDQGWAEFHRELNRARRFDRPFGIVRFAGVGAGTVTEMVVRDRVAALARRIDRVWLDDGDLFLLLPESDAAAVETAVARAQYRLGEALGAAVTATFPANGITSGSLVASLYRGDTSPVAIGALGPVTPPTDSDSAAHDSTAGAVR